MQDVDDFLDRQAGRFVSELCDLLRIPSVSGDSAFRAKTRAAAEFVRNNLQTVGVDAELVETPGHPIVVGRWQKKADAPTVLIYGHYDVQPPDPLDKWITPPFEPTERDGYIYARGATDDKGQMFTHIKSVEAWLKTKGELPLNVIFVIEGEEEVGSRNLDDFLESHREQLKCDVAVISDTSQYSPDLPAITYGLRGILAAEIRLQGPAQDLHSGIFGGSIANPATALARLLAALHDDKGRVQIPGFYDDVLPLADAERKQFAALPFNEAAFLKSLGTSATFGEAGFTTLERRWARPTCEINGMVSGYIGEGPKTIVPSTAMAKITCRLVPDQNHEALTAALKSFFEQRLPPGITMEFESHHGAPAFVFDPNSPYLEAAKRAIAAAFGTPPVLIREGGSIPVVSTFRQILGVDTLLLGWGQNTDNLHSPNERFRLVDFQRGIRASAYLWQELAALK
ncbi:MAG: dipeptidase [Planctomycetaceae bacterium]